MLKNMSVSTKTRSLPKSMTIWIAAVAFQHGLPLYTLDNHFSHVEGLLLFPGR